MVAAINPAAINAYAQAAKMGGTGEAATPGSSFGELLNGVLNDALKSGREAEVKAAGLVQGKGDLVDVVTAVNSAEMTLETVVAIRDKVIAAYQDILRMPI
ncbi:MAG: flagellar hook-basal body complex protein FliE [Alphaproteobacteria bacterium]|nr:flagellar hook-basal body complex protein FliE [Alphaproteobacteria bacterium]